MEHKKKLEELNQETLKKLEEYMREKELLPNYIKKKSVLQEINGN